MKPIALRFISEMGQNPKLAGMHLSGMGGIETWLDALEFILLGCGRCFVSCRDGGHQAIIFGEDRKPYLNPKKCVGCHLCVLVCPQGAITSSQRRIKKNGDDT